MSRSEFKGRRLRTDCLAVTPLSQSAVEAIYGMEGTLPKHAVDNLCKSHERLRAELSGAMILLAEHDPVRKDPVSDVGIDSGMPHSIDWLLEIGFVSIRDCAEEKIVGIDGNPQGDWKLIYSTLTGWELFGQPMTIAPSTRDDVLKLMYLTGCGRRPENRGKHPCRTCGVGHFRDSVCDRCGVSQAVDDAKYRQWLKSRG
jgi:hypothetical protein